MLKLRASVWVNPSQFTHGLLRLKRCQSVIPWKGLRTRLGSDGERFKQGSRGVTHRLKTEVIVVARGRVIRLRLAIIVTTATALLVGARSQAVGRRAAWVGLKEAAFVRDLALLAVVAGPFAIALPGEEGKQLYPRRQMRQSRVVAASINALATDQVTYLLLPAMALSAGRAILTSVHAVILHVMVELNVWRTDRERCEESRMGVRKNFDASVGS